MNISLNGTFARILLAFMLAFGLMIPTSALATGTANNQETVTPHVKLGESDSPNFTTEDLTDSSGIKIPTLCQLLNLKQKLLALTIPLTCVVELVETLLGKEIGILMR